MTAVALALIATLPFAAAAWLAGWAVDRAAADAGTRAWLWSLLFALPLLAAAAIPALAALPGEASFLPAIIPDLPGAAATVAKEAAHAASPPIWQGLIDLAPALLVSALAAGAVLRLALLALRHRRLAIAVKRAEPLRRPDLAALLSAGARRVGAELPPLALSDETQTPLLAGLRAPVILLPRELAGLPPAQLALVCLHELAHLKRRDNAQRLVEDLLLALVWFNPAMAAIQRRLTSAREEVCDGLALTDASDDSRRDYARTLVQTLRLGIGSQPSTAFIGASRSPNVMRLKAILNPPGKPSRGTIAVAGALTLAAVAGLGGGAAALAAQIGDGGPAAIAPKTGNGVLVMAKSSQKFADGRLRWEGDVAFKRFGPDPSAPDHQPARFLIDGKPAPTNFIPEQLDPATVKRVDGYPADPAKGRRVMTFNIVTFAKAARYEQADAVALKTFCASEDAGENGFCAGMLIGVSGKPGICAPKGEKQVNDMVERGQLVIRSMDAGSGQPAKAFAIAAMRRAWPCT